PDLIQGGGHHYFYKRFRPCHVGPDAGSDGRILRVDPVIPDRVHAIEVLHVLDPELRCQQLGLVGSGHRQILLDCSKNGRRLTLDVARGIRPGYAANVDGIAAYDAVTHPRTRWLGDIETADAHGSSLEQRL